MTHDLHDTRPARAATPHAHAIAWNYTRGEIAADAVVHAMGVALAIAGAAALIVNAPGTGLQASAVAIYLAGLLAMLGCSAAYNLWPVSGFKWWLRRFDHAAIYLLIAATYTAFLLPIGGALPHGLLIAVWLVSLAGMAIKIFWPRRFDRTAIVLYLALGWSGLLAVGPMTTMFGPRTLALIAAGGILYSAGVIFHVWESLRFQNAIWHGFVLLAALCHFAAVALSVA